MHDLTCGTDVNGNPIAVDNSRRNKGKFLNDLSYATQAEYPELAESFLALREPSCVVDLPTCAANPGYPAQNYSSANDTCATSPVTLTFLPVLDSTTGTYEVPMNTVLCNGFVVVHDAIHGTSTLSTLVAQLNIVLAALGTWAVSGSNITLSTTACTTVGIPWLET
jgi:hypothetical protein